MKILYFHQHFSTPAGSGGTRSYEMARRLLSSGHEVTMICGNYNNCKAGVDSPFQKGKRRGFVNGIEVIKFDLSYDNKDRFPMRSVLLMKSALRSVGVALREPANILFATSTPLTAGIPGIVAKWIRREPLAIEVRDLWPGLPRAMGIIINPLVLWAMGALEWANYKFSDRLIGLSPGIVGLQILANVPAFSLGISPNKFFDYWPAGLLIWPKGMNAASRFLRQIRNCLRPL